MIGSVGYFGGGYSAADIAMQFQLMSEYNALASRFQNPTQMVVDRAIGMAAPNLAALKQATNGMNPYGNVSTPISGRNLGGGQYLTDELLNSQQSVQPMQVPTETMTKKGVQTTMTTQNVPVRISPQQVEARMMTDPAFRDQMQRRLGGQVLFDGTPDGRITVNRFSPEFRGYEAGAGLGSALAASRHLNRMDTAFLYALSNLGCPTMPGCGPDQAYGMFGDAMRRMVGGMRDAEINPGGAWGFPGFLSSSCPPGNLGGSLQHMFGHLQNAQELMYQSQLLRAQSEIEFRKAFWT